jgi:hypothetical protein
MAWVRAKPDESGGRGAGSTPARPADCPNKTVSAACEVMGRNVTYGGATAYLSMGWRWRVWDDHMHRTHGAEAGLVLQDVGTVGVRNAVAAVTLTARVTGRI